MVRFFLLLDPATHLQYLSLNELLKAVKNLITSAEFRHPDASLYSGERKYKSSRVKRSIIVYAFYSYKIGNGKNNKSGITKSLSYFRQRYIRTEINMRYYGPLKSTGRQAEGRQAGRPVGRQEGQQADRRQTGRQTGRQAGRLTSRQEGSRCIWQYGRNIPLSSCLTYCLHFMEMKSIHIFFMRKNNFL